MPADPNRVRDVFLAAVELSPEQRPGYLAEACRGDAELRAEVDRLLAANAAPDSILEPASPTRRTPPCIRPGPSRDRRTPGRNVRHRRVGPDAPSPKEVATEGRGPDGATGTFTQPDPDATTAAESGTAPRSQGRDGRRDRHRHRRPVHAGRRDRRRRHGLGLSGRARPSQSSVRWRSS